MHNKKFFEDILKKSGDKMSGECVKRKKVLFIAYVFPPISGSGVQKKLKIYQIFKKFMAGSRL